MSGGNNYYNGVGFIGICIILFTSFNQNVYAHGVHDLYDAICYFLTK